MVDARCRNTSLAGHWVHFFPSRVKTRVSFRAWVCFVQIKRQDFTSASVTKNLIVCGHNYIMCLVVIRMRNWSQVQLKLMVGLCSCRFTVSRSSSSFLPSFQWQTWTRNCQRFSQYLHTSQLLTLPQPGWLCGLTNAVQVDYRMIVERDIYGETASCWTQVKSSCKS